MHNTNNLISIVLPTYNGAKYLRESIDSVLAQDHTHFELIIIDDCSTDNTKEIVKEYLDKDARISYFRNEKNLKLPASLNRGFSLAKGTYLSWMSDDNIYSPTALSSLLAQLQNHSDCDLVYSSYTFIDAAGVTLDTFRYAPENLIFKCVVGGCFLYSRRLMEKVGTYDPEKFKIEDFDFWMRAILDFKFCYVDDPALFYYRKHKDTLSSEIFGSTEVFTSYKQQYKKVFEIFLNGYMKAGFSEEELQLHTRIFFNDVMKVDAEGNIDITATTTLLRYFDKLAGLQWEHTNIHPQKVRHVISEARSALLSTVINNLLFINKKLAKQNPRMAKQFGKPISWYYQEYETLPPWYKKFGHIIKAVQGNRSWHSLVQKGSVK